MHKLTPSSKRCSPPTLHVLPLQCPTLLSAVVHTSVKVSSSQLSVPVLQLPHGALQLVLGSQVTCKRCRQGIRDTLLGAGVQLQGVPAPMHTSTTHPRRCWP